VHRRSARPDGADIWQGQLFASPIVERQPSSTGVWSTQACRRGLSIRPVPSPCVLWRAMRAYLAHALWKRARRTCCRSPALFPAISSAWHSAQDSADSPQRWLPGSPPLGERRHATRAGHRLPLASRFTLTETGAQQEDTIRSVSVTAYRRQDHGTSTCNVLRLPG